MDRRLIVAAFAVAALFGCATAERAGEPAPKAERSSGQFTDDARVTAQVKTAIATEIGPGVAASIDIDTYRGVVNLTGFVDSEDEAKRALAAARQVEGVRSVTNDIRVKQ